MASFLAKLGWDRPKKRKKKKVHFREWFLLDLSWSIPKKIQKKKKRNSDFISSQTKLGRPKREKKNNSQFFFLNKKVTKFEKLKNIILVSFLAKPGQDSPKKRKKNFHFSIIST